MHFDIPDLRLFIHVAEANSLTGGARRASLSTAAASMRIKALEGQLGSRLFYRDSQGVELTPAGLADSVFSKVFRPEKLTFGILTQLEGYPLNDSPTMEGHTALAKQADDLGFAALCLRDVPFRDPAFGDVALIYDPMVYTSWLAAVNDQIAIGTAGIKQFRLTGWMAGSGTRVILSTCPS